MKSVTIGHAQGFLFVLLTLVPLKMVPLQAIPIRSSIDAFKRTIVRYVVTLQLDYDCKIITIFEPLLLLNCILLYLYI